MRLKVSRVVVVCTGNICRSPMAAALLREKLSGDGGTEVLSAGLGAVSGDPAELAAREAMLRRGFDISAHRARQIVYEELAGADLVLVMDGAQEAWLCGRYPMLRGRVHRLGRWCDADIPDPFGGAEADFERAYALIDGCVTAWCQRLAPVRAARDDASKKPQAQGE